MTLNQLLEAVESARQRNGLDFGDYEIVACGSASYGDADVAFWIGTRLIVLWNVCDTTLMEDA